VTRFNEERTVANLYLNLRGGKRKKDDWVTIAKDMKRLSDFYKSPSETARKLGVSYELVRSIMKILELPEEVQGLIREGKILYDAAQRLSRLDDPKKQIDVARAVAGLTSHQARDIIQYAKKNPDASLSGFRRRVIKPKATREEIHLTVLPIRQETFRRLQRFSERQKIPTQRLILNIIEEWLMKRVRT